MVVCHFQISALRRASLCSRQLMTPNVSDLSTTEYHMPGRLCGIVADCLILKSPSRRHNLLQVLPDGRTFRCSGVRTHMDAAFPALWSSSMRDDLQYVSLWANLIKVLLSPLDNPYVQVATVFVMVERVPTQSYTRCPGRQESFVALAMYYSVAEVGLRQVVEVAIIPKALSHRGFFHERVASWNFADLRFRDGNYGPSGFLMGRGACLMISRWPVQPKAVLASAASVVAASLQKLASSAHQPIQRGCNLSPSPSSMGSVSSPQGCTSREQLFFPTTL